MNIKWKKCGYREREMTLESPFPNVNGPKQELVKLYVGNNSFHFRKKGEGAWFGALILAGSCVWIGKACNTAEEAQASAERAWKKAYKTMSDLNP